jgi:hypothetical protein
MMKNLIACLCFIYLGFLHADSNSGILDLVKHARNQSICNQVMSQHLTLLHSFSPQKQAKQISRQVNRIAQELLAEGLDLTVYSYGTTPTHSVFFSAHSLWEGQSVEPSIPLSLLIYAWPPENYAKQCHSPYLSYSTPVHSHPISCAFTVLQGTLLQELFLPQLPLEIKKAKKIKEEILSSGQVTIDEPSSFFAHRMVCQDQGKKTALSLHAYGAAKAADVQEIFRSTAPDYQYSIAK